MNILLTGATGYIGKRLLMVLSEQGHTIHCVVRNPDRFVLSKRYRNQHLIHVHKCDLRTPEDYDKLPTNIDVAFYLVHAMSLSHERFNKIERNMASNFANYINTTQAKQIIYLGGIANDSKLSKHLYSRLATEQILATAKVPLTVLRAAIIIGSGSASFEIIRDLVEKLPFMIAPKWIETKCQPICVRDVLSYLKGVMGNESCYNKTYDIGGPNVLTYKQMLMGYAKVRKLKRSIISIPVFSPRLSSYWLYFVTSTNYALAVSLVSSMKNEVVCQNNDITKIVQTENIPYKKAVALAFGKIAQNSVVSSWKDAVTSGKIDSTYTNYLQVPMKGCFHDKRIYTFDANNTLGVVHNLFSIGGNRGWYYGNWLWKIRGLLDKLVGGVGLRRGRRNQHELIEGDALDFWRVLVADRENKRLLLFAEMKLPGEAWLEFKIVNDNNNPSKKILKQRATFRPKGILGRLYWYAIYPLHFLVFPGMAKGIIEYKE